MKHALQVYLDDADFRALSQWTRERGWTMSQAVRIALKALTGPRDAIDPLLAASGMIDGLPEDLSRRVDEQLQSTFVAERPAPYGRTPARRRSRKTVRR
jgi:hypothetical protein